MQRFCNLKSEIDRLAELHRCFGRAFDAEVLDVRDALCAAHPALAPYLSDVALAAAMDGLDLSANALEAADESLVLRLIGWAHVRLPQASMLSLGAFLDPTLQAMARAVLRPSTFPGLPHTVLMRALQELCPGEDGPQEGNPADDLLRWYYLVAVPRERLHRCVGPQEIEALNASQGVNDIRLLSLLDIWALHQQPEVMAKFDFTRPTGQIQAREAAWAIRERLDVFDFYRPPFRPRGAGTPQPRLSLASADPGRLVSEGHRIPLGAARWFGNGQPGNALLLAEEWAIESEFAWALAPISTLVFVASEPDRRLPRALGITIASYAAADTLGQTLTLFLNGVRIVAAAVGDALSRDVVACHDLPFVPGLNVLQFGIDKPLIPAVQFGSHDQRALGVALRRLWLS